MADSVAGLRVALVAGTLGQGGAEKQLVYVARTLKAGDAIVRVFALTRGEYHDRTLRMAGLDPTWVGQRANALLRVVALARALRRFRPHVVHSAHFFTNLHAALAATACGSVAVGSIRSDGTYELATNGSWSPWLLRAPALIVANSTAAAAALRDCGVRHAPVRVVPNVIDLSEFDASTAVSSRRFGGHAVSLLAVGSLVRAKRIDRLLAALALARREAPSLRGSIVGDGPERAALESLAGRLGLLPDGVRFLGRRDDVPRLMCDADVLAVSSEHEGFPNVILEAMAARLPVVAAPVGDVPRVVEDGHTGYVVPFTDPRAVADRLVRLASSPALRRRLGEVGRARVEQQFGVVRLAGDLATVYAEAAGLGHRRRMTAPAGRHHTC